MLCENNVVMEQKYKHVLIIDEENASQIVTLSTKVFTDATIMAEDSVWKGLRCLEHHHHIGTFPDLIILSWDTIQSDTERFLQIYQATFYPRHLTASIILISRNKPSLHLSKNLNYSFVKNILPKPLNMNVLQVALQVA